MDPATTERRPGAHRAPKQKAHWPTRIAVMVAGIGVVVVAMVVLASRGGTSLPIPLPIPGLAAPAEAAPDRALPWGPMTSELARAQAMVRTWSPSRLAGQVIVGRYHGTDPEGAAEMVKQLHLAGLSLQSENVTDADQVREMTGAIRDAVQADDRAFPPVITVDQEGGTVAHLVGIATTFPAYADAGAAIEADREAGRKTVREAAEAAGLELRSLGFTWVNAPDADVTSDVDTIIRSRAASDDPEIAARAIRASVKGYRDAGVVSTLKHFVGHGSVATDSHEEMPVLDKSLAELRGDDLLPFRAGVDAGATAVMMSHIAIDAVDPGVPASLSSKDYDLLARETGFDGLVITDSLGMGAVIGRTAPGVQAINAGADLLLMPADTELAHATLTQAIKDGDVPRARILDAAATVVAMQLWQARVAAQVPVPDDVTERAEMASARLDEAG
ncbi:glycoside hydrolase family 3 N-terminal domain-containing protein [Nocardioides jejuensis]|uniref:beta-N-acetylhexosaminidase n=1 Tax=Nocardioides jejuensis TaxID=2502782 RepID=A0A4R1CKH5_9ACTN|nr:glycoside hydrolase family 3 N-terminal domain-containing protein [Nocardioides jejuensis]TCJ30925.1 glycosyl hyrolase family 3 [Nocardioides jejuensis]